MNRRPRRLRANETIRTLVRETSVDLSDLVYPLFITYGENIKEPISSMPGVYRFSIDKVLEEIKECLDFGIKAFILFGIPEKKDEEGRDTWCDSGIIQRSLEAIKQKYPEVYLITDVCFCEYTSHGHCGVILNNDVDNDLTLENLKKQVVSHAKHGADMVAPSGMMDNMIAAIREALDSAGFYKIPIMAYSAKYASKFYGPFRDAADSAPSFGDRRTYQMDPANKREAIIEMDLDFEQGADIIMVKPALAYLDIIHIAKERYNIPIAAYNVSGEYSMIKAAHKLGYINGVDVMNETLLSIKRAGADIIITYFAKEFALQKFLD
ncbi:Porphobilinogen synthase [Hydrogenobaculum sp. Y04AAS1]|uniref:porphobilinogen synthase n=1 Tax=Hydrogenobaculum sp. (strain Y04AAS1) TaxID=380749 RepID=UPI00015BD0ED|nr:Porphobilinogen synthase [Hydrogenobaculum sp. Y04AAS1]HCT65780.1 porphobilinogen synthase [Hydrogenobaculum sp.]